MSDNQFEENEKEKLEKEIEELKKQKEIKDLQKQKEELEREIFGNNEKSAENIDFYEEETENKYVSNKMTTILAAIVAVIIAIFAGGLFYLRSQNKKRENLKNKWQPYHKIKIHQLRQIQLLHSLQHPIHQLHKFKKKRMKNQNKWTK